MIGAGVIGPENHSFFGPGSMKLKKMDFGVDGGLVLHTCVDD